MKKGIKLFNEKSESKKIIVYNKPEVVYIPLISGNDTDITLLVRKGDYVFKGTPLGKRKGSIKIPIISTISGRVLDFVIKPYIDGSEIKYVKIENDFKEKVEKHESYEKIDKSLFLKLLHDKAIIGLGGDGFPTHIKYDTKENIKTLLVNAVECEPYVIADYEILKNYTEEILETIDMILDINYIDEAIIAVKETDTELIKIFNSFVGTYLKIRICEVPNTYPMGYERILIKQVLNMDYKDQPIEKGIVVNNVSTVYAIYKALKYDEPFTEKIVTFSGDIFESPQNFLVKIGTEIKSILNQLQGYDSKSDVNIVVGGTMRGKKVSDEVTITPGCSSVLIMKNTNDHTIDCIRCGKCIDVCPMGLCPLMIKENINKPNKLKKLNVDKCIECGLCSYICPSRIPIREIIREAKEKI